MNLKEELKILNYTVICEAIIRAYYIKRDGSQYYYRPKIGDVIQQHYSVLAEADLWIIISQVFSTKVKPVTRTERNRIHDRIFSLVEGNTNTRIDWSMDPYLVVTKNSVVGARTCLPLNDVSGIYLKRAGLGVKWDVTDRNKSYRHLLTQAYGQRGMRAYACLVAHLMLDRAPNTKEAFYIYGKKHTGKSTLLKSLTPLFANYGPRQIVPVSQGQLDNFMDSRQGQLRADLMEARVAILDDVKLNMSNPNHEHFVRSYVAGETVTERGMYEKNKTAKLNLTVVFASNYAPIFSDADSTGAVEARLRYHEVKRVHDPKEEKTDIHMIDMLEHELHEGWMGFINLEVVPILRKYAKIGKITTSKSWAPIERLMDKVDPLTDSAESFLMDVRLDATDQHDPSMKMIAQDSLYALYKLYMRYNEAEVVLSENVFLRKCRAIGNHRKVGKQFRSELEVGRRVRAYCIRCELPTKRQNHRDYFDLSKITRDMLGITKYDVDDDTDDYLEAVTARLEETGILDREEVSRIRAAVQDNQDPRPILESVANYRPDDRDQIMSILSILTSKTPV